MRKSVKDFNVRVSSETVEIKTLDLTSVMCQFDGCGTPALYLFSTTNPRISHGAYCEIHASHFADRTRVVLPSAKERDARRRARATA
jgi:hypothetical protein